MVKRISRPSLVKKLQQLWGSTYSGAPYLKSVEIGSPQALRGIKSSKLEIQFPVTVLCGPNGTGKTTFLALSVLAFHDNKCLTLKSGSRGYYDFSHFFISSDKEKHEAGVSITWEYTNGHTDNIKKGKERWLRYIKNSGEPRRPVRGCEFVGLSRIVPAFEKRGYHKALKNLKRHQAHQMSNELASYLQRITGKSYRSVISYEAKNSSSFYRLNDYESHTSFNAGAGEECLTFILDTLLQAKEGSIIAIEEIEIGLHPSTLRNLVDAILDIAIKRKLQILITTHSPDFLRACPKESLVLAARVSNAVVFTHMPNVENAVYSLLGKAEADLYVVCEDECSAAIIESLLNKKEREVVSIKGYGGKDELISKAEALVKATKKRVLVVWDGDTADAMLQDQRLQSSNIFATKLPGNMEPEKFITASFSLSAVKDKIIDEYNLEEADWQRLTEQVATITDVHDTFYIIAEALNISDLPAFERALCKIVVKARVEEFSVLKGLVAEKLAHGSQANAA